MGRFISGARLGTLGLVVGLVSPTLSAQALGLPASDAVGIGRSGTGVAFGASLEAAALNPALLATLRERSGAYVGLGMELQSTQTTLMSNQQVMFSSDRNRVLPSLGAGWRLGESLAIGLKLDQPFLRHAEFPSDDTIRFVDRAFDLETRRLELQGAWALNPHWSFGLGIGITRITYASEVCLRAPIPAQPTQPVSGSNLSQGLVEIPIRQEGHANALSYSLGFRWAIDPRWTIGGAYQGAIKASLSPQASIAGGASYFANDGFGTPPAGIAASGASMMGASSLQAGSDRVVLPARAALGVRQRVNQFFTWELDLRYIAGGSFELPSQASYLTPSGTISVPVQGHHYKNGWGLGAMSEFTLSKAWSARMGAELLPAFESNMITDPAVGGSRTAGFSLGCGYKLWGGQVDLGYQFRQSLTQDSDKLDVVWDAQGRRSTGGTLRTEGKGHLWSIGYKRTF